MAEGHRPVAGVLPVGVVSMDRLRTPSNDNETKVILKGKEWGNRAKSMYKLGNLATSYKCVYK